MNRYPEYKHSGIDWLGLIPSQWSLKRVAQLFSERKQKVDDKTFPPLSVTMDGVVDQLSDIAKTDHTDNRKLVREGDFVINSRSDRKGSSGISPRDGSVSVINIVMEPRKFEPSFYEYLFKSFYFKEEFFRNGKGIHWDLWSTKWDQLKVVLIPVPDPNTQSLISKYLHKKTSQVDSLIEKIERKIELLKKQRTSLINQCVTKGLNPNVEMKDSGVEWIGEIPSHWKIQRLATLGNFSKGKNIAKKDLRLSGYPCILYSQIYTEYNRTTSETASFIDEGLFLNSTTISRGTFLFTSSGESVDEIGKCILYFGEEDVSIGGDMVVYQPKTNACFYSEFLSFVFNSTYCQFYKSANSRGDIVVHIYEKQLRDLQIVFPEIEEQIKISDYLKKNDFLINNITQKETERIKFLKEYRQSLISNFVTGKLRVMEDMI